MAEDKKKRGLKKGQTNNPNGRPEGSVNKVTGELRVMIKDFLTDKYTDFLMAFDELPAAEKARSYISLVKYAVPAMQAVSEEIDFNKMTQGQLEYICKAIENRTHPTIEGFKAAS